MANNTTDRERLRATFFTPTEKMPPPRSPRRPRPYFKEDPGLRALHRFVKAIEPLPERERNALLRWLADKYPVVG